MSNIIVYLGADDARDPGDSVGEDVVLTAVSGVEGRGHIIITDNFFTSPGFLRSSCVVAFGLLGRAGRRKKDSQQAWPDSQTTIFLNVGTWWSRCIEVVKLRPYAGWMPNWCFCSLQHVTLSEKIHLREGG